MIRSLLGVAVAAASCLMATSPAAAAPEDLGFTKSFSDTRIAVRDLTSVTFTLTNSALEPEPAGFTDILPESLDAVGPLVTSSACDGTLTVGQHSITLENAMVPAQGSCTFSVTLSANKLGVWENTATLSPGGLTAKASITIVGPPVTTKAFGAATIAVGETTPLSFTLVNPNTTAALTGIGFTDPLPAGLVVAGPNGVANNCPNATVTATPGSNSISVSGATLSPSGTCTIRVNVTATSTGIKENTTSPVSSGQTLAGAPASASITVVTPVTDLRVALRGAPNPLRPGNVLTYTATVINDGPNPAHQVVLTDQLPGTVTFNSVTPARGSCTAPPAGNSGTVVCDLGNLASGAQTTVSIQVTVGPFTGSTITNTVSATPVGGIEPDTADNTASYTVSVR
ncbi:DUF11 domain-containing protein [Streptomyces sp. NPDC059874]|uniref:DUF11 domain-containing protein n=1 Tax=Streptomyces sp. NPDC059874 TaxID=3346983 RepID=UPI00366851D8